MTTRAWTAAALAAAVLAACGGGSNPTPRGRVATVKVIPQTATIGLLAKQSYQLELRDASGNLLPSDGVVALWQSSDTAVGAFLDPTVGEATGVGIGKTEIRATVDGKTSDPAELNVVAQGGGGGGCNFARARWKGPVSYNATSTDALVGRVVVKVDGDVTFESSLDACRLNLVEGTITARSTLSAVNGCTLTQSGTGPVKPPDGAIILENRPRDVPPRVKYSGEGQTNIERVTITNVCPDPNANYTLVGPVVFGWLGIPVLNPEYFTDPALSSFTGTYTVQLPGGSGTFEWNLTKQPLP
jgi:hypothetical protein